MLIFNGFSSIDPVIDAYIARAVRSGLRQIDADHRTKAILPNTLFEISVLQGFFINTSYNKPYPDRVFHAAKNP
jgi:hypothetical protein